MKKLNIADWFSVYRIIATPFLLLLIFLDLKNIFIWLLLLSFLTDMIDGIIARALKIVSEQGAKLDSYGDLLTYLVAIVGVFRFEWDFVRENFISVLLVAGLYFLQLLFAFWRYGKPSSFHTYLTKAAAIALGTFIMVLFVFGFQAWLFYTTVVLAILDAAEEIIITIIFPEWKTDVKGLYWMLKKNRT